MSRKTQLQHQTIYGKRTHTLTNNPQLRNYLTDLCKLFFILDQQIYYRLLGEHFKQNKNAFTYGFSSWMQIFANPQVNTHGSKQWSEHELHVMNKAQMQKLFVPSESSLEPASIKTTEKRTTWHTVTKTGAPKVWEHYKIYLLFFVCFFSFRTVSQ